MAIVAKLDSRGNEIWEDDGIKDDGIILGKLDEAAQPPFQMRRDPLRAAADEGTVLIIPEQATRIADEIGPMRNDIDKMRDELNAVPIQMVQANSTGKRCAEQAGDYDNRAKNLIDAVDAALDPVLTSIKRTENAVKTLRTNLTSSATQVRLRNRDIQRAYQLAVQAKIDAERREAERRQREAADREQQERLKELQDRQAVAVKEAVGNANPAVAGEAAMEVDRLGQEITEVASTPVAPVSVSTTAIREQFKVPGQQGVTVYVRVVKDVVAFLGWAARQAFTVTIPEGKRNHTIIQLGGIEITINCAGLRSRDEKLVIPGIAVTRTIDPRSAGRRPA